MSLSAHRNKTNNSAVLHAAHDDDGPVYTPPRQTRTQTTKHAANIPGLEALYGLTDLGFVVWIGACSILQARCEWK